MYVIIGLAYWGNKARQEAKVTALHKDEPTVFSAFSAHKSYRATGHFVRNTTSKQTVLARAEAQGLRQTR